MRRLPAQLTSFQQKLVYIICFRALLLFTVKRYCRRSMSRRWPAIGTPWILGLVENFGRTNTKLEPQLAQVLNFVKSKNNTFDNMLDPAAVVHIMDWHCYIQAVITKEAKTKMEREEQHFMLEDINNQVIILKEFKVLFMQEKELPKCAFYIRIEHFNVMPMETDRRQDVMNCNADPSVKWMIKEYWKKYRDEHVMQGRDSSDESLTQLLNFVNEEKLTDLKNTAHMCLNLRGVTPLPNTNCSTTIWKTGRLRSKTNKRVFSVPIKWLIISPEEEKALDNLEEWRDDYRISNDNHEVKSYLNDIVIPEQPSTAQETPKNSQTSQASQLILRAEEDEVAQPDSSTPDMLENVEANLQDDLDRSQSSLFTDSNEHGKDVFEDNDAVMCENLTSIGSNYCIDSGVTCGQKSHYVNDDTINQSQLSGSDTSILLDMCYLDKESENTSFVGEQEKNATPALCSVMVDSLSNYDILQSKEDEHINKKCFGQSMKKQAMKRTKPTEVATTFVDEESGAGRKECAEKRPKIKDCYPLLESEHSVKTRRLLRKPELQFLSVHNNRDAQEVTETSNQALCKDIQSTPVVNCQVKQNSTSTPKAQERLEDVPNQHSTNNMRHFDGSRLQYRYEAAGSALCTKVRSARLSGELLKWAFQVVFETEQKL